METCKELDCLLRFHVTAFDNNICMNCTCIFKIPVSTVLLLLLISCCSWEKKLIYSHIMYKDFVKFIFAGITESRAIEIDNYLLGRQSMCYISHHNIKQDWRWVTKHCRFLVILKSLRKGENIWKAHVAHCLQSAL